MKLKTLYKTLFNYFLKKDSYGGSLHVFASAICTLVYLFALMSCLLAIAMVTHTTLHFKIAKAAGVALFLGTNLLTYLFHFYGFHFPKKGENTDGSFLMKDSTYKSTLRFLLINFIVFFLLLLMGILLGSI